MGVKYITDQGTDGLSVGKSSSDLVSFYGATPIDKPGATEDLKDALISLGLYTTGGATPLNLDGGTLTAVVNISADSTWADGVDIAVGTSVGTKIGTASTQKLGFLGATPVVRQGNTADIKDTLVAFGLLANGGATPLNLDSGALTVGAATIGADSTLANGVDFALGSTTGSMFGTASTQRIGFLGATPVVRQANTTDLKDTLVNFGFIANGGATPLNLDSGALTCGAATIGADSTLSDGVDFALGTSVGTKIGTASTQKLAFFNASPIVRPSGASQAALATTNPVSTSTNWGFATSTQAKAITTLANAMRTALVNLGLLNGS